MKRILLNILEIKKFAKSNKDAEILLTFALAIGPNKIISNNFYNLKQKLHIDSFPNFLITKGYFDKYPDKIVSRFTIEEPQCYMTNASWLHYPLPSIIKSDYLHILGQRSLDNKTRFFPEYYLEERYRKNPLINHSDRKIKLILEK